MARNYFFLRIHTFLLFSILLSGSVFSQGSAQPSPAAQAEKIYLQLDNTAYSTDQTVWFKAIVTDAALHAPGTGSGVLYAELTDPNENIVDRKTVKLQQGIGNSFFQLAPGYTHGIYQVRGYTAWNRNFGPGYFFTTYITVAGPQDKREPDAFRNLTVTEDADKQRRISVLLAPEMADSSAGRKITFIITTNAKTDTVTMKKNGSGQYVPDYIIPASAEILTVQVQTENNITYSKTVIPDPEYTDLQFFPEGGDFVHGLPAAAGFKVTDSKGKGRQAEGEIINSKKEVIARFKTNKLGMGIVVLNNPDSAEKYMAVITSPATLTQKYRPLPDVKARGYALSVRKVLNSIIVTVRSNYKQDDSVQLRASCRGDIKYLFKSRLTKGFLSLTIPVTMLPEGVIELALLEKDNKPVAERLFFNERKEERINVTITADKGEYAQRQQTQLTIETAGAAGNALPSGVSLLVYNKTEQGPEQDLRQNILSYFLLSSDIRGTVETPGYYFGKEAAAPADLDALLLTQGWRRYNFTDAPVTLQYKAEENLSVTGEVKGGLFNKKIMKQAAMTLMTFGKNPYAAEQKTDSLGRFAFPLADAYGQNLKILIQSSSKTGIQKNYQVILDKKTPPPVLFNRYLHAEKPDSFIMAYIKRSAERKKMTDSYLSANEGITLQGVTVNSYLMTPERKKSAYRFGKPATVIEGTELRAKEAKWSYGLYSVLLFNYPEKVRIVTNQLGEMYLRHVNRELTLFVIDGIAVRPYEYQFLPSIPPGEISSFEIIENAKDFNSLCCEVFPQACINCPASGNVIAIYTYGKKGLEGIRPTVGILNTTVPVFSAPKEFYAPRHEQLKAGDWQKPDLRSLIHWDPLITTNESGKAAALFFNPDNTGTVGVVVEAISANGEIGYGEITYDLKKKK